MDEPTNEKVDLLRSVEGLLEKLSLLGHNYQVVNKDAIETVSGISNKTVVKEGPLRVFNIIPTEVDIYEVLGSELDKFAEQGKSTGTSLQIATSALSVCLTILITLFTTNMTDNVRAIWTAVCCGTGVPGLGFLVFWLRTGNSLEGTIKQIKDRKRL
jgi:hypothetical protein